MKIGDKVRFLNEVGGGVIASFVDKNTVMVTDESGFDMPFLRSDLVVIETDEYNLKREPKAHKPQPEKDARTEYYNARMPQRRQECKRTIFPHARTARSHPTTPRQRHPKTLK